MIATKIHSIWSRELKLEEFADTDDFFDIGGHSLIMTRIQREILSELGIEIPMDQLFRKSTVAAISEHIETALTAAA
ncbi:phosphopantetheine-binding protein [Streptomyces sp. NPDC058613]|uniref:phosphopantetheine-binding protein n=1 Tax=unclassified Streptomyces TaxID=2593676 RepID=UPI00365AC755